LIEKPKHYQYDKKRKLADEKTGNGCNAPGEYLS